MRKLARIEKLLKSSGVNGLQIIDSGKVCTKCNFIFCTCPMTDLERSKVKPKGFY